MNIFYLDEDIIKNAQYHCNRHVVKMITEYTQILCNTYYTTSNIPESIYKSTHNNHPCCIWARESLSNWLWLKEMSIGLYKEYQYRYGKEHKAGELAKTLPMPNIQDIGITTRPQAMPVQYRELDTIDAYRNYYRSEKIHLIFNNNQNIGYKNREVPNWLI
jgi:hypothetical protein